MKCNKAYKFRIYPDEEQKIMFAKTFGCARFIWNKMLADKIEHFKETGKQLKNTPAQYKKKKEFEWLNEVDCYALCNVQINLQKAFRKFFDDLKNNKKAGFPKFKSRHKNKKSYTTNNRGKTIRIENGYLRLPKLKNFVKIKLHRKIPDNYKIKSATVSQNPNGNYYVSILFEYESQVPQKEYENFLGLDYSMKELYVDSDGNTPCYPRYYRKAEERLKRQQRKLSLMQKGSANRDKQRIKVARLHEKVANQRKDFLHKLSRKIANTYDCVCIEDLNMHDMAQALNFGKSVSDNGWGMFTVFLKYKLEEMGKRLVKVGKFFASSQICSVCGYKNPEVKDLSVRSWDCPNCKTHHDRDVNAAINIKKEGIKQILI